jgi:hypothetical protein
VLITSRGTPFRRLNLPAPVQFDVIWTSRDHPQQALIQTLKIRAALPLRTWTRIDARMSEMLGHLKSKLKASLNFPSPPAIAQQIITLARDPSTDISQVAVAISRDPALAAKLLRVANSAL